MLLYKRDPVAHTSAEAISYFLVGNNPTNSIGFFPTICIGYVKEKNVELTQAAKAALDPAREMTGKLKSEEIIPEGLINGTIYKLKKKFL